jgi:hypothetical protein
MTVKALRPEMLYDSLSVALFPALPKGGSKSPASRPQPLPDISRSEFVRLFGTRPVENEGSIVNSGVPQFLWLLNSKILSGDVPGLQQILKTRQTTRSAIEDLYLTTLARRPRAEELQLMTKFVEEYESTRDSEREALSGILWALVNSAEFVLNH